MYQVYADNRQEMVKRGMRTKIVDKIETVLNSYLKVRYANERVIWTNYMHNAVGRPPKPVVILKGPQTQRNQQGGIEARFAVENKMLVLGVESLNDWLNEKKYQSTPIYDMLENVYKAVHVTQLRLASGTIHGVVREPCYVISNIDPNSPLGEFMMMCATDTERKNMADSDAAAKEPTGFEGVLEVDEKTGLATNASVMGMMKRA
jgi:hypothetical protein